MEDSAFSDDFCRFLQRCVASVDAAELLLRLASEPDRWLEPAALASGATGEAEVARCLEQFQACGLIDTGADKRIRYRAGSPHAMHVETLAQAYKERPVTLFRVIYALRDLKIRSFADAFRLTRK